MTSEEFKIKDKSGEVEKVKTDILETKKKTPEIDLPDMRHFIVLLEALRMPKRHVTSVPTNTPKTFADSIQFYDDGSNVRLYVYVNKTWRYVALT